MTTVQQTSRCDMMPAVYNSSDSSSLSTDPTKRRVKLRFVCGGVASERIVSIATDLLPAYTSSKLGEKQTTVKPNPTLSDKSAMAVPADEDIIKKQIKTGITRADEGIIKKQIKTGITRADEDIIKKQVKTGITRADEDIIKKQVKTGITRGDEHHQEQEAEHLAVRKPIGTSTASAEIMSNSTNNFTKASDHGVQIPFQERIESAKRKLHERYEECDKAKKQHMTKMMSFKDVQKLGDGSKSRLKPAVGKKLGGGRKSCLKPAENKKVRYLYNEWV